MSVLLTNIAELVTNDPAHGGSGDTGLLRDAAVVVEQGRVAWTGPASRAPAADAVVDAGGRAVVPGFVDSHSHTVFAGDRAAEFAARMTGEPYTGGGIATTVAATRSASDDTLRARGRALVGEMLAQGTTTVEIKSGYGQDVDTEARTLRIARELTPETTFLGAHTVPAEYADDRAGYVDLVTGPMLAACAPHARWVDVFCEPAAPTAFDEDEARTVLRAGQRAGLLARVHGNQLAAGPGVRLAVEVGAASVDHCTHLTAADVDALAGSWTGPSGSGTVATLLPAVEFSTRSPYPDARRLLRAGVPVALATDCNPGSGYSSSMPFVVALAVREMRMSPTEALWSATAGGALALRRDDVGHLRVGARADLTVLDAPTHLYLAYRPGVPLIHEVWQDGVRVPR
ncbi:imidazolonepropionase [Promicromonospora thailandica]|uniref:Imidazolonepropionase n=1 Tax=Promicromonospora thailandica TaxID=765201 RepID=A0A9X2JXK6_9MICO|nr:imidazolonepropionase [Promicromonospora thailandica]MCP2264259.1 imidazolonepropionase [Promicromonospora thailandica]BFF21062.1 imidazolonepropionase [Promicromonospora thailandica]